MEKERKINWLSLFIKIIIIFIFVLIIIWLFSKISTKTRLSDTLKNNINNMETVATNYYKNIDLPLDNGKSLKITLGEMIEKGLIVSINDNNGTSCDLAKSFSKIVRKKENYILYTTLKCGKEKSTITKKISLKDCKNCQKDNIENEKGNNSPNKASIENSNNSKANNSSVVNENSKENTLYYEYVKESTTYSEWGKGNLTGTNVENKYEYYSVIKETYYSVGIIKKSDFYESNKLTYTLKINNAPNKNYYFTKIDSSSYFDINEKNNYINEKNIKLISDNIVLNGLESYSLNEENFTYVLSPYYRKGSFYVDVEIKIKNTENFKANDQKYYYVPLKMTIKYISNNPSEMKPTGDYEMISYYRYIQTNRDIIWSSEQYVDGYTKTGNTELR